MTHRYIGTKVITAWPQDRIEQITSAGDKKIHPGYAVKYPDGYVSWSPQNVFCDAYRVAEGDVQALTFGDALHFVKLGLCVTRAGWNGPNQYVFLIDAAQWKLTNETDEAPLRSFLVLRTTDGKVVPWAPSGSDALAEDWRVL